jgi:hypothetical protein
MLLPPLDDGIGSVDAVEDVVHLGDERSTGRREAHAGASTDDEADAELVFETVDVPAERGATDGEAFGGATEVTFLRDAHEHFDLTEFHVGSVRDPAAAGIARTRYSPMTVGRDDV